MHRQQAMQGAQIYQGVIEGFSKAVLWTQGAAVTLTSCLVMVRMPRRSEHSSKNTTYHVFECVSSRYGRRMQEVYTVIQ